MAKGKSKAASKADKSQKPAKASKAANKTADKDALRQAVEELGGDDADLELIAGVDSDDEAAPAGKSGDVDEVSLTMLEYELTLPEGTQGRAQRLHEGA